MSVLIMLSHMVRLDRNTLIIVKQDDLKCTNDTHTCMLFYLSPKYINLFELVVLPSLYAKEYPACYKLNT